MSKKKPENVCRKCNTQLFFGQNWHKCLAKIRRFICKQCYCAYTKSKPKLKINKNKQKINDKKYRDKLKFEVLTECGGAICVCCGETNILFLTLDHINNDGALDRKNNGLSGNKLCRKLRKNKYIDKNRFRVLCYNCNIVRGHYGLCPHEFEIFKNNCADCGTQLTERTLVKNLNNENYIQLFKNSGVNLCLDCSLKRKNTLHSQSKSSRIARTNKRSHIITEYGGKCECCGEQKHLFLSIDHINNDGKKDRKLSNQQFYKYLMDNNFPKDNYRLLCYNCNCGRGQNGSDGVCPHKKGNSTIIAA